jgi:hypothetical protein
VVEPAPLPGGTVLSGYTPTVALVVGSNTGEFLGFMELSPESAQILGEELRKAAEAAQTTLEGIGERSSLT